MEQRKLDYILERANLSMDNVDKHFSEIDDKMSKVYVGLKMIDTGVWDDYPVEITRILDKEKGIVEIFEPGYGTKGQHRKANILDLRFKIHTNQVYNYDNAKDCPKYNNTHMQGCILSPNAQEAVKRTWAMCTCNYCALPQEERKRIDKMGFTNKKEG